MAKHLSVAGATVLMGAFLSQPAAAQPAAAPASATVNLNARLAEVQADPRQVDKLFKLGRKVAAVCAYCHGEGGNSLKSDVPNLAGQNPAYLLEQLRQFADGQRRNPFMEGMIKAMNGDEKIGMVLFYAAQEVVHKPATNVALVTKGQEYYGKVCFRCHGTDGRGNEQMARIAGQQSDYLGLTLRRYRDGSNVRVNPLMASNTRMMSDPEIEAVVAFVSSMK